MKVKIKKLNKKMIIIIDSPDKNRAFIFMKFY